MPDIPRISFHQCPQMPRNHFAEKQLLYWHVHRTGTPHSEFRVDLRDGICPYCGKNLDVKERPIIFSGQMVHAILDEINPKTQTRRVIKPQLENALHWEGVVVQGKYGWRDDHGRDYTCPYGRVGDRLWVRETFRLSDSVDECGHSDFPCTCPPHGTVIYRATGDDYESKWKSPIHMPRWASRITLEITDVRVERVRDISLLDCLAEGIVLDDSVPNDGSQAAQIMQRLIAVDQYGNLWDSLNAKRGFPWVSNPWAWVIKFQRIDQ